MKDARESFAASSFFDERPPLAFSDPPLWDSSRMKTAFGAMFSRNLRRVPFGSLLN